MTSGYSGTPLAKKLGIKTGMIVRVVGAPEHYLDLVAPLPPHVMLIGRLTPRVQMVHHFTKRRNELARALVRYREKLHPDAMVWISWPKKVSKVPTDVTEDTIRGLALQLGFVDVKVCAVDEVWSGLKLLVRKELRP